MLMVAVEGEVILKYMACIRSVTYTSTKDGADSSIWVLFVKTKFNATV